MEKLTETVGIIKIFCYSFAFLRNYNDGAVVVMQIVEGFDWNAIEVYL